MGDLEFKPVLEDTLPLLKGKRFSTMYMGRHCEKNILILKHQLTTLLVALRSFDDEKLNVDFQTAVSSREKSIHIGFKIVGSKNVILLLDGEKNLWRLINAFEFSNEQDECLYLIDEKCFYEWVPFKKFINKEVLQISGTDDEFAALVLGKESTKTIEIFSSLNLETSREITLGASLSSDNMISYHFVLFELNSDSHSDAKKALYLTDKLCGRTYSCLNETVGSVVNVTLDNLVSILYFQSVNCLLLCFQNGKLVFLFYADSLRNFDKDCFAFLGKQIICIEKCECSNFCIIWSDGRDLNHTSIILDFKSKRFVKLLPIEVKRNIVGVIAFHKGNTGLIAVTFNNFYYHIINSFKKSKEIIMSSDSLLEKIYEKGLEFDKLNKDIKILTECLQFKEIMQSEDLTRKVELGREGNLITLRTKINKIFKKDIWKVRLRASIHNKHFVEITDLESDFCEGMILKIKTEMMNKEKIDVSLVGDFNYDSLEIIVLHLGTIEVDKDYSQEIIADNLSKIAKKRNLYLN